MNSIVLDTNCYAAYRAGDNRVLDVLVHAKTVWISVTRLSSFYQTLKV